MHMPGAQGLKSMHPAGKMSTQGAGCTLNFEHSAFNFELHVHLWVCVSRLV